MSTIQVLRTHPAGHPVKSMEEAVRVIREHQRADAQGANVTYLLQIIAPPRQAKAAPNGNLVLTVDEKLAALRECIAGGHNEDAIGHLFDLLHHVAPGLILRNASGLAVVSGIMGLHAHYGETPTPVLPVDS